MAVVRERERGTLEQLLVSPLSRWGLMLGKLDPVSLHWNADGDPALRDHAFVFAVPIAGSVIAMMLATLVYVFALLSLGLLVATKAENQMQALQMSMTFIMPSVFFSGFIFPRETMPWIFYAIGALLPTTYFIDLMRAIILRGAKFLEYWPSLAHHVSDGGAAVLCLLAAVPEEDRLSGRRHHILSKKGKDARFVFCRRGLDEDRHVPRSQRTKVGLKIGAREIQHRRVFRSGVAVFLATHQ